MKKSFSGFTLVELLVVITILAIISVVAYQNFGGAVDKAVSGRKITDVSTIETALQQFKVENNYYPAVNTYSGTGNVWGYNNSVVASPSNSLVVTYTGEEINTIVTASTNGGGRVMNTESTPKQVGAKGTISRETLTKKYLSQDLYDPELGDIKVGSTSNKMIDYGIGRYVYGVYKKPKANTWGTDNKTGTSYNIAYTIKKSNSDTYVTKIVGDYDKESCFEDSTTCPATLIGSGNTVLTDGSEEDNESNQTDYGVPYAVSDFHSN